MKSFMEKMGHPLRALRRKLSFLFLALLVLALAIPLLPKTYPVFSPAVVSKEKRVLLVPLDGRPPCRQFVIDMGKMAGIEVITPPTELQDYYSQPGETKAMQSWLLAEAGSADAVIVSIDQLLYGGLLAAREKETSPANETALIETLVNLRKAHPSLPVYAFSILPRLQPADSIDGYEERRDIVKYSRLIGKKAAGQPIDEDEIKHLRAAIPPESLESYLSRFQKNAEMNRRLLELSKDGVLTRLILGQDDGEPYGIPNIEKASLEGTMKAENLTKEQAFLTHGADEIAMTLLAAWAVQESGEKPRYYLHYADNRMKDFVMPYMAVSTDTSIREKVDLIGGSVTESPDEADILLTVSTNDSDKDTLSSRRPLARWLDEHATQKPTALIDLSYHFNEEETVLPLLMKTGFPVNQFAAYAGWNTTSNAAGTAIAAAALRDIAAKSPAESPVKDSETYAATAFLLNRLYDDGFYLKTAIGDIDTALRKAGYMNPSDLDLTKNYCYADAMLESEMTARRRLTLGTPSFTAPFTSLSGTQIRLKDLHLTASFPWPRTFEIYLETAPLLERIP